MKSPAILDHLSALADTTRSRILLLLDRHELTVSELCGIMQLPQSTVSRHLKALADTGWIAARSEGTSNLYAMTRDEIDPSARRLWALVREQVGPTPAAVQDQRRVQTVLVERRSKSQEFFSSSAGQWDRLRDELFGERFHLAALPAFADAAWTVGDLGCYAAMRRPMPTGDRWIKRAMSVAHRLEIDCMVASEVDRRLSDLRNAELATVPAARDQCLRDVHAELSLLRERAGEDLQPRLDLLLDRIGSVMGTAAHGPAADIRLTQRQIDVLLQIATGASNAEAADRLGLTPATVKSYLQDAARRLGARNRVEAIAIARRSGLLP